MEKILKIEEGSFSTGNYDGFVITTDKQVIQLGISNGQSCCESWGYFMSQDDFADFIGAELIGVSVTDDLLNVKQLSEIESEDCYTMFVNINTSKGVLQFIAYNSHNGYYGHTARVISNQLKHNEVL